MLCGTADRKLVRGHWRLLMARLDCGDTQLGGNHASASVRNSATDIPVCRGAGSTSLSHYQNWSTEQSHPTSGNSQSSAISKRGPEVRPVHPARTGRAHGNCHSQGWFPLTDPPSSVLPCATRATVRHRLSPRADLALSVDDTGELSESNHIIACQ